MKPMTISPFQHGRHLAQEEMYDAQDRCPICLCADKREPVLAIQNAPEVLLLECKNCRGRSASRMPLPSVLAEYYGSYYGDNTCKITFHSADRLAGHILEHIDVSAFSSEMRLLDFGGGDGSVAIASAKKIVALRPNVRVRIVVVDYCQSSIPVHDKQIELRTQVNLDGLDQPYDIVLASGVLEHIPELHGSLQVLLGLLSPGGYFYSRTPYMSPFKKIVRMLDMTYPAHVHDLGASFWNMFTTTFRLRADTMISGPSIVETELRKACIATAMAYACKLPGHIENLVSGSRRNRLWPYYGGWEVLLKRN